ncbi:MAG: DUF4340 domain-containing protein [Chloroflexi bacterium]|nr:DUF4340 domain-containing protein [Chloroflexota bacterium]
MSFRITALLLVALAALGSYVFFYEVQKPDKQNIQAPWVYNIDLKDINAIKVVYQGKTVDILWDEEKSSWFAREPVIPKVDNDRVNGIRVLLSGPRSKRVVARNPQNLAAYGLDTPRIQTRVGLNTGEVWNIKLGEKTPDGGGVYVMFEGYDVLYIVDYTWSDELSRFVTEPPIPKPGTPAPAEG